MFRKWLYEQISLPQWNVVTNTGLHSHVFFCVLLLLMHENYDSETTITHSAPQLHICYQCIATALILHHAKTTEEWLLYNNAQSRLAVLRVH